MGLFEQLVDAMDEVQKAYVHIQIDAFSQALPDERGVCIEDVETGTLFELLTECETVLPERTVAVAEAVGMGKWQRLYLDRNRQLRLRMSLRRDTPPRTWAGLVKLQEEAAELGVELAKLSAYPEGPHPDGRGVCIERVMVEAADVTAAITWFCARHGFELDPARISEKLARFQQWDEVEGMSGRGVVQAPDGSER